MSFFKINSSVGNNMKSKSDDVLLVRRTLAALGYQEPNTNYEYIDSRLDQNIREFQRQNGLRIDGLIRPSGETEAALMAATKSLTFWCPKCGAPHGGSKGPLCPDCHKKS